MPEQDERVEILRALARKMDIAADVDLEAYAEQCEYYTGADLQALLYNAHLKAIHEAIDTPKTNSAADSDAVPARFTLFAAGGSSGPSLTVAERGSISQRLTLIRQGLAPGGVTETGIGPAKGKSSKPKAIITNEHMKHSIRITQPSITPEEHFRLTAIYNEFVTGRNGEMPSGIASHGIGQRTTLW